MFGPQDVKDYINAVRQTGNSSPLVRVELLPRSVAQATQAHFLAYSIIPVDASGGLATDGARCSYVAMPHVFARTKDGCGQWMTPRAKAAKLTSKGFADSLNPVAAATEILRRIVAVYGLPDGSQARPQQDQRAAVPQLPAASPLVEVRRSPSPRSQPIANVFGATLDQKFPLVLVVGREGNNSGAVTDFIDRYNWEESGRSAFWTSTYTYFARICGLGTATDTKRLVSQRGSSPIVFANAAGIVIPNAVADKERLRAAVQREDRKIHVETLLAHEEITSRLAFVILSGLDDGESLASKRYFEAACAARGIPWVSVPYFYGTNLDRIAKAIQPDEERVLKGIFETFLR